MFAAKASIRAVSVGRVHVYVQQVSTLPRRGSSGEESKYELQSASISRLQRCFMLKCQLIMPWGGEILRR